MAEKPVAAVALFETPEQLLEAVPRIRSKGLGRVEAYTPYPVHGLAEAVGHGRSLVGYVVLLNALAGAALALGLQWWTSAIDYPVRIGGKPLFSWPAFVPIIFEVMVLLSAFAAVGSLLMLFNKLPLFGHPLLKSKAIKSITRDRFALAIELETTKAWKSTDVEDHSSFDVESARQALEEVGGQSVEILTEPEKERSYELLPLKGVVGVALLCAMAGGATYAGVKIFPVLPPMSALEDQRALRAQRASAFFADGRGMREPVPGTVARGHLPYMYEDPEEAGVSLSNPLPTSQKVLERGRRSFETFCSVCHGVTGNGQGSLSDAYGASPANLQANAVREYPDGQVFHFITAGKNTMPGYSKHISADDRWAIVHYLRALQRSQNATDEDMKLAKQMFLAAGSEGGRIVDTKGEGETENSTPAVDASESEESNAVHGEDS